MNPDTEHQKDCAALVARTAMKAAEFMPTSKRIMIHHGVAMLFPKDSDEHKEAKETANALATAEKKQLKLTQLLEA